MGLSLKAGLSSKSQQALLRVACIALGLVGSLGIVLLIFMYHRPADGWSANTYGERESFPADHVFEAVFAALIPLARASENTTVYYVDVDGQPPPSNVMAALRRSWPGLLLIDVPTELRLQCESGREVLVLRITTCAQRFLGRIEVRCDYSLDPVGRSGRGYLMRLRWESSVDRFLVVQIINMWIA